MQNRSILDKHARLVSRMAEALGIDLDEAAMRGVLPQSELTDAVLRCTGCTNPDQCARWLDESTGESTGDADDSPAFCRNSDLFRTLKEKLR
jgi:hypothetical protein